MLFRQIFLVNLLNKLLDSGHKSLIMSLQLSKRVMTLVFCFVYSTNTLNIAGPGSSYKWTYRNFRASQLWDHCVRYKK